MADRRAEALSRGDLPRAPAWTGWWVGLGGLLGAGAGLAGAPWRALGAAAFGGDRAALGLAAGILQAGVAACLAGALAGLIVGQLSLGPLALQVRRRLAPGPAPRRLGLAALAGGLLATLALPAALGRGHDPGGLLLRAVAAGAGLGALGVGLAAVVDRARGVAAWRRRIRPEAPPRRDPDAAAPEARQALKGLAEEPPAASLSGRGPAGGPPAGP